MSKSPSGWSVSRHGNPGSGVLGYVAGSRGRQGNRRNKLAPFILGGIGGALVSKRVATALSARSGLMSTAFAVLVIAVGIYVSIRGVLALR